MENQNSEQNVHYICTGSCKGVSETPGVCQAQDCPKHGQELIPCSCVDGKHGHEENEIETE